MSATTVKLLKAAEEVAGSRRALATRLGIGEPLLSLYMADGRELPDTLLLRAVDMILQDREIRRPHGVPVVPVQPPASPKSLSDQ